MRTLTRVLLALVLPAVLACLPAPASASFPGANGVIAYSSEGSIWAVDPTTGNQLRLTTGPGDAMPSFSPSGDQLAFQRATATSSTIYVAHADGAEPTPLTSGREPAFSPDGQRIVFVRPGGLFVTGAMPGSPIARLTGHPGDNEPRWGSTGTIVFERARVRRVRRGRSHSVQMINELDTIAPPSHSVHALLTYEQPAVAGRAGNRTELHPDWSPAATKIVVALCNEAASSHLPFNTVPTFILHLGCSPSVWAPNGAGLAEPGVGALSGRPKTSCPHFVGETTEISWQPLQPGTLQVPTVSCASSATAEPESGVEPNRAIRGSRTCYYDPRRHRRRCFTT